VEFKVILKEAPTFRVIVLPFDDSLKVGVVAQYEKRNAATDQKGCHHNK
jgi:hypothetical protein